MTLVRFDLDNTRYGVSEEGVLVDLLPFFQEGFAENHRLSTRYSAKELIEGLEDPSFSPTTMKRLHTRTVVVFFTDGGAEEYEMVGRLIGGKVAYILQDLFESSTQVVYEREVHEIG